MIRKIFIFSLLCLTASIVHAGKAKFPGLPHNAYLDGGASKVGIILAHGRGHGPKWDVVNPLRRGVHKKLGYHTLSLQMPTRNGNWESYGPLFPDAYKRIHAAINYLRSEKNVEKIYLMGHSMGSRMVTAFLAKYPESGVSGYIGAGTRNYGGPPLNSFVNLRTVIIPVVDIYGDGGDGVDAFDAKTRSEFARDRNNYKQVLIKGADHRFRGYERELVDAAVNWLKEQDG